jgi:hypothetical protein
MIKHPIFISLLSLSLLSLLSLSFFFLSTNASGEKVIGYEVDKEQWVTLQDNKTVYNKNDGYTKYDRKSENCTRCYFSQLGKFKITSTDNENTTLMYIPSYDEKILHACLLGAEIVVPTDILEGNSIFKQIKFPYSIIGKSLKTQLEYYKAVEKITSTVCNPNPPTQEKELSQTQKQAMQDITSIICTPTQKALEFLQKQDGRY